MTEQTKVRALIVGAVIIVGGFIFLFMSGGKDGAVAPVDSSAMPVQDANVTEMTVEDASSVKEFSMTAYYDETGKWFSLKEMSVKKGDVVRVKITNTKGMHDFTIDELNVATNLPLDQEVVVEFTADTVGEFVYYCSVPGHRAGGQWGTLKVTE